MYYCAMKNRFNPIHRSDLWSFVFFWLITVALYIPAWKSGFERDFHGWMEMYHYLSFKDAINSKTNDVHSLYQVTQLQLYCWTWLLGTSLKGWFLLHTFLHAAVSLLMLKWLRRTLLDFKIPEAASIAWLAALLFVCAPANAEIVIWKASYHYLIALIIILSVLRMQQFYFHSGQRKWLFWMNLLFLVATFTLELYYVLLPITVVSIWLYFQADLIDKTRMQKALLFIFLPFSVLFVAHLLLFHAVYGGWLPHVQQLSEDALFSPVGAFGRMGSYEFHLLALGRFFPNSIRGKVYAFFAKPVVAWLSIGSYLLGAMILLVRYRRLGMAGKAGTLLYLASGITLSIILQFWISDLFLYWNDRYLYLTSVFQFSLLALAIAALFQYRKGAFLVLGCIAVVWAGFTFYTSIQCRRAAKIFWGIQEKFEWKKQPKPVIILNMPNSLNGSSIIYAEKDIDIFNSHLYIYTGDSAQCRIQTVAGYNMVKNSDGAITQVIDSMRLKVTLGRWGCWWWNGWHGASDYENDLYRVHFTDPAHEYELTLKKDPSELIILRNNGDGWTVVNMRD